MRETLIVPESSRELFLPVQAPYCEPLRDVSVIMAGIAELGDGFLCDRKGISWHLLLYTTEGEGALKHVPHATRLCPGDLFIAPAETRYAYVVARKPWKIVWFHLLNQEPWAFLAELTPHVRHAFLANELLSASEHLLAESMRHDIGSNRLVELYAEQIAVYLERELGSEETVQARKVRQQLHELWDYVNSHLEYEWSVKKLADRVFMSASHLHRLCQQCFGRGPMQMVGLFRMRRAEELLANHDFPLKIISEMVGYGTPYAFSIAFKQHKGMSPSQYRAKRRQHV